MRRFPIMTVLATVAAVGCVHVPDLDNAISDDARRTPYPKLVPVEQIRADIPEPRISEDARPVLESRAAALKRRAGALKGPVIDQKTKSRMARGVSGA